MIQISDRRVDNSELIDVTCEGCGGEHLPGVLIWGDHLATMLCFDCANELMLYLKESVVKVSGND